MEPAQPAELAPPPVAPVLPADADRIAAYARDCYAEFAPEAVDTQYGAPGAADTECTWREFDQSCAPDHFGCWSEGEACRDACSKPCSACEDTCGRGCATCADACGAGDDDCRLGCAGSRAECEGQCLSERASCQTACSETESACEAEGRARMDSECPPCSDVWRCVNGGAANGDGDCAELTASPECVNWCTEG